MLQRATERALSSPAPERRPFGTACCWQCACRRPGASACHLNSESPVAQRPPSVALPSQKLEGTCGTLGPAAAFRHQHAWCRQCWPAAACCSQGWCVLPALPCNRGPWGSHPKQEGSPFSCCYHTAHQSFCGSMSSSLAGRHHPECVVMAAEDSSIDASLHTAANASSTDP